jgi:hypothetical protein
MRRLWTSLAALGLFTCVTANAFTPPPFPRLAVDWIANQRYQDPAVQAQLAHGDIVLLQTWPGWSSASGVQLNDVLKKIKAVNPNLLVFQYINNNEVNASASTPFTEVVNKVNAMKWWLYPTGTSGTPVPSAWAGTIEVNNTLFTPKDSAGDNWISWYAKWTVRTYATPNPLLDGFVTDNVFTLPRVNGDWNRDGTLDGKGGTIKTAAGTWLFDALPSQLWYRQGYVSHFDTLHKLLPGKYQIGNVGTWGDPNADLTLYQGKLDGGVLEAMIGRAWSVETWADWKTMMSWYRKTMAALGGPKLGIFSQVGDPHDYQGFRYGFASCLMDDGYYTFGSIAANNGDWPWFDEYAYQWKLGASTSSPPTTAWQKGVYRRDFENGIALVNPKGNGTQTVTLETSFKHLSGTQVPAINNGKTVTTVTLADRDGVLLLRMTPQAAPKRPAPPAGLTVR